MNPVEVVLQLIPNGFEEGMDEISKRKDITIDLLRRYPNLKWKWDYLTRTMSLGKISMSMDLPWNLSIVKELYPEVFWSLVTKNVRKIPCFECLTLMNDLPMGLVYNNPDLDWKWYYLTRQLSTKFIEEHCDYGWDYREVSYRRDLSPETIHKTHWKFGHTWDWVALCLTMPPDVLSHKYDMEKEGPRDQRALDNLSLNENIPWSYLTDKKWSWNYKNWSARQKIDWEVVSSLYGRSYYDRPKFDWLALSQRVSIEELKKYRHLPFHFDVVVKNPFIQRESAASRIQAFWRRVYYRPGGPHEKLVHSRIETNYYHKINS